MNSLFLIAFAIGTPAGAARYAIVIGNNSAAVAATDNSALSDLRFADDDAAAMYDFFRDSAEVDLLSVLDARSQRRFPEAAKKSVPPTWRALEGVITRLEKEIRADQDAERQSKVWIYFSGHGGIDSSGAAYLALADEKLTQQRLYRDVLDHLPANEVHLLIDACHAEAVVRPRGIADETAARSESARATAVSPADASHFLAERSLRRYPQVGAVMASSFTQVAHEWDEYEQGVFTHQLLSGLRGGADVNQDGMVEYSELHAFLAAANREVLDERAKLDMIVVAPPAHLRAVLSDRRWQPRSGIFSGPFAELGRFLVEDERGVRLVDEHFELEGNPRLMLPANRKLFVRSALGDAEMVLAAGDQKRANDLSWHSTPLAARGALASALKSGLFATPYGPIYYRGFVDRAGDIGVTFAAQPPAVQASAIHSVGLGLLVSASLGGATAIVFGSLALVALHTYDVSPYQVPAAAAASNYRDFGIAALAIGGGSLAAAIVGAILVNRRVDASPLVVTDSRGHPLWGVSGRF